jgi:hypothetical protein
MKEWSRFWRQLGHEELAKQSDWMYQFLPIVLYYSLLPTLSANNFNRYV